MVMILCECVSVVVNIWGVGHLALHQGSKYAEQICVPTWVNQVETHRQDRWTYAREHTLARTPRSAPSWMNNLALRSNAGHRGTWQFLCKCGFVCFCVLSLWTSMINHIVWGFPPFITYCCLSCQFSCPWWLLPHPWPTFAHTSRLMFISFVYLSIFSQVRIWWVEKKSFHVYFMPKQIFLSQEVWIQFSLRSDRKARGYRRTEKRSGSTEVKVLKASFITFSAAQHP